MASVEQNKIVFDQSDWLSGLNGDFSTSATDVPIVLGGNLLTSARAFNPYRYLGYACPGFGPVDVTNVSLVTSTPIRSIVLAAESGTYYGYGINSGSRFFQLNANTGTLTNSGIWPYTVTAASGTVALNDIVVYDAKVGGTRAKRVFYSYNRTGADAWDVGCYSLAGIAPDNDFMTTAPSNPIVPAVGEDNYPHPLIVGDDDVLYIGNGNILYGYDGASTADDDGEVFTALTLPGGFRITSFARMNQRLAIFGYYEPNSSASPDNNNSQYARSMVYWWDYLNIDPFDADDLYDNYVNCAFEYKNTIGCFTYGRKPVAGSDQTAKLQIYNGSAFETVASFDSNAPLNKGVDVVGDTVMWNSNGTVYQWGSPFPGFKNGLNKVAEGLGSSSGAIRQIATSVQLISTGTTTSGGLQTISSRFGTGFVKTQLVSPSWPKGQLGKVTSVKVEFAKTSSGGRAIDVILTGNNVASTTVVGSLEEVDAGNFIQEYYYDSNGSKLPYFTDIALILQWQNGSGNTDAPIVKRVEISFETVNDTVTTT